MRICGRRNGLPCLGGKLPRGTLGAGADISGGLGGGGGDQTIGTDGNARRRLGHRGDRLADLGGVVPSRDDNAGSAGSQAGGASGGNCPGNNISPLADGFGGEP